MTLVADTQQDTLRETTREAAKQHKASWLRLGQYLYTIYKDKLYKSWSFMSFETYCMKELHIKQTTASKLMKSYFFLEKEEPRIVDSQFSDEDNPKKIPDYEAVNLLRLAKDNQKLTPHDVAEVRDSVLEKGKEAKDVRAQVKRLIEKNENKDPQAVQEAKKNATIKRMISVLKNAKIDFQKEEDIPKYIIKQMGDLIEKLEAQFL